MIKLKTILTENELQDKFGDIAFGSDKDFSIQQGKSETEPDTEFEEEILQHLYGWISDERIDASEKLWKHYELFKKAKTKYPGIFAPSNRDGTLLYRGLSRYSKKFVDSILKSDWKKWEPFGDTKGGDRSIYWWKYTVPIEYTPTNEVQSWTSSAHISHEFALSRKEGPYGDYFFVMLSTTQNDEYLFNSKFLSKIATSYWGNFINEEETLHFGKSYKDPVYVLISDDFYLSYQRQRVRTPND